MQIKLVTTDPTYLRTIYDGLLSGAIHKDNASALPAGLVGMYEESLPPTANVNKRKKFLELFATWALLKKEVSADFLVLLLEGWTAEDVIEYIGTYSKWFNSPESGKYVLYHERFRTFVLQKVSHRQFEDYNNAIIHQCQLALKESLNNEWERYALEHLSSHILINAMESSDGSALKALAYNTNHWNRQIEISKGFEWSKSMLNDMMLWASKYDEGEVIECALNKVDLHHMEQNDAPHIVQLVTENDIATALQRIESFGGNDKEGLQRKFILYMFCLMELTILESKDKPFRKEAIEELLKHLDENLPVDHIVLNWNEFFPSYLMFQLACAWDELGLDYLIVYKRAKDWDNDWISEMGPYSTIQVQVLLKCVRLVTIEREKCLALNVLAAESYKQGQFEQMALVLQESLSIARGFTHESNKSDALNAIALELIKLGKLEESLHIVKEISSPHKNRALHAIAVEASKKGQIEVSLAIARGIGHKSDRSLVLTDIALELSKLDLKEESALVLQESLATVEFIGRDYSKIRALLSISIVLSEHGRIGELSSVLQESLSIARDLIDVKEKSRALMEISFELYKQGRIEESFSVVWESFDIAQLISEEIEKVFSLNEISHILYNLGRCEEAKDVMQKAIIIASRLLDRSNSGNALHTISVGLCKRGRLKESLNIARSIGSDLFTSEAIKDISIILCKEGQINESLILAREISITSIKCLAFKEISSEFAKQKQLSSSLSVISESLSSSLGVLDEHTKSVFLEEISTSLLYRNQIKEAKYVNLGISDYMKSCIAHKNTAIQLSKLGKLEESFAMAYKIPDEIEKVSALMGICLELEGIGEIEKSISLLNDALSIAYDINDEYWKIDVLKMISKRVVKMKQHDRAFVIVESILNEISMIEALNDIAIELSHQGQIEESKLVMEKSRAIAEGIYDDLQKCNAMKLIAIAMSKQGKFLEAASLLREILATLRSFGNEWDEGFIIEEFIEISIALRDIGLEDESSFLIRESMTMANNMRNEYGEYYVSGILKRISLALIKDNKYEESLSIVRGIDDEENKSIVLKDIAAELINLNNWGFAEKIGFEIPQIAARHECWKTMAAESIKGSDWQMGLQSRANLNSKEAQLFYLKGWANAIGIVDANDACAREALPILAEDPESIEMLLQKYAARVVSLGKPSKELTDRLNRTLNIQWLLDITAQFPKQEVGTNRSSSNLSEWLHEIQDEDDREQIELWAKQVAKGKIKEEEFRERVRDFK